MFILFSSYLPSWLEARTPFLGLVVTFVMALLMVSRVRYFSFKEYGFLKTHAFSSMISALLVFVLILSQPVVFGFLLGRDLPSVRAPSTPTSFCPAATGSS